MLNSECPTQTRSELRDCVQTLMGAVLLAIFVMMFIARAFTVDGPSMLPTLHSGERLLIDKLSYHLHPPRRGDVVVFRYPADTRQYFIKRIIGEPGDVVLITGGTVWVNGQQLQEDYVSAPVVGDYGPYYVPPQHYFVLGDNRNNSEDSRSSRVGFVPRRLVVGRALLRYWPLARLGRLREGDAARNLAHASP